MALFSKETTPPPQKTLPPRDAQPQGGRVSYVGPNLVIDGTVTGDESLIIEGAIRGKINLESDLRVGPNARIEATVHANNVTVEGVVVGDISADARLELIATARVDGNLKAPKIIVAEGARFRGSVDMGSDKPAEAEQETESKEKANAGQHGHENK